jgi:nicotinamidase-related amidase
MADFSLESSETALVLIEYQNEFTTEGGKLHDAVKECMDSTGMLGTSKTMMDAARAAGLTIIHVPINFEPVSVSMKPCVARHI